MIHFELEPDLEAWKEYALQNDVHTDVVSFLSFRPELLFRLDRKESAFPTPRSWEVAGHLHGLEMDVRPAVGGAVADEFRVYCEMVAELPDLAPILKGKGEEISFPSEMSARYSVCVGLAIRSENEQEVLHCFEWLDERAGPEWVQLFVADAMTRLQGQGRLGAFATMVGSHQKLGRFVDEAIAAVFA
jgi:hypothetical protein